MLRSMWELREQATDIETIVDDVDFKKSPECPDCGSTIYEVRYVDPVFKNGKYAICKVCLGHFDLEEDGVS